MTLVFHIPPILRTFTAGRSSVSCDSAAATVADALAQLFALHPGLRDRVTDERGEVRQHVNVFLGAEAIRFTGGLATPLPRQAGTLEISIVPAVSGGLSDRREAASWA